MVQLKTDQELGGGKFSILNKTGDKIVTMSADEDGNGVVGAWNRQGKGRTLESGP